MELKNIFNKSVNRKSFFASAGLSAAAYFVLRSFPFNLVNKNKEEDVIVSVKINTQSVSRTKIGGKNV